MSFSQHVNEFKKFDFAASGGINAIGTWPLFLRLIVFVVVFVGILVAGWFYYLVDSYEAIEDVKQQEITLREKFAQRYPLSVNLEEYKEQMVRIEAMFESLLSQLPGDTEVPALLEDITRAGLAHNLEFEEIKLMPEKSQDYYTELPIQITVVGSYHNLGFFTAAVGGLSRIVTLHDFTLTPISQGTSKSSLVGSEVLRMTVLAKTYRNKK